MPALPDVPGVLKVALIGTAQEDTDVVNRIFFHYSGTPPTGPQLDTFAGSVVTAWGAHLAAMVNPDYVLTAVEVEDLTSSTSAVGSNVGTTPGTRTGAPLPAATCAVVQEKISRRYRGGHPRVYLYAGGDTDILTLQSWKTSFTGALNTAWQGFLTDILAAGWSGAGTLLHVNVSYYQGFTNTVPPSGRAKARPTLRGTPVVNTMIDR